MKWDCVLGAQEQDLRDVEMPGQWLNGEEAQPDHAVMLERIGADVAIVRRHSSSYRRLQFIGSDGKVRYFLVQTGQHSTASVAGRFPFCCARTCDLM